MCVYRVLLKTRKRPSRRTSTLDGCTMESSKGSIPRRPTEISARMSRSESSTGRGYRFCGQCRPIDGCDHTVVTEHDARVLDSHGRAQPHLSQVLHADRKSTRLNSSH